MLALGTAGVLAGCTADPAGTPSPVTSLPTLDSPSSTPTRTPSPSPHPRPSGTGHLGPIPGPNPGSPQVISGGPTTARQIALTIDDGYNPDVVAAYVEFAQRSGIAITFSPNGTYQGIWNRHAKALRPLIADGQVQIGNHTYTHLSIVRRSPTAVRADVERNDDWIRNTFGVTSRPYFRPPYGSHTARTDDLVAGLGYTKILMWNGSFGDSTVQSPRTIMNLARRFLQPGVVMLGHANHDPIVPLLPMIEDLIKSRDLHPVTLDRMFGTSRQSG